MQPGKCHVLMLSSWPKCAMSLSLIVIFSSFSFCSCSRLAAGMNMSPVSRLKKTWSKVKTAKFDILEVSLRGFS